MSQSTSKSWGIWSSGKQNQGAASPLGQQEPWARSTASTPNTGSGNPQVTGSIGNPPASGPAHAGTVGGTSGNGGGGSATTGLAITSGAMETFGELLSQSPQNGRRDSPDLPRTSSPFLHMRESRQRQATAAQAAALAPSRSPGDHFGAPAAELGSAALNSNSDEGASSHTRMKSVLQNRMEHEGAFITGPTRSTSTPPFAVPQATGGDRFGAMPFFTPQVPQRGFEEPAPTQRETDVLSGMRSMHLGESGKTAAHAPSPYIAQSAQATPFMPQGQQGGAGFGGPSVYQDYGGYDRGYEEAYRMQPPPPPNAYAMYGADPYAGYQPYDTRSMPRGGYRTEDYRSIPYGGSLGRGSDRRGPLPQQQDFYGYAGGAGGGAGAAGASGRYYDPRAMAMPARVMAAPGSRHANARREDPAAGMRSQVLEDFRSNKAKKVDLADILGYVVEFSGDQHGSRFIQQKLETASSDDKEALFQEILPNCLQLMTDVFGNYVIQKFFEHGNQVQKTVLAKQMETHVLSLSLQMYGCRVVQKALEHVLAEQQASMVKELDGHVLKCVKDQNGNHVIQKALERVPVDKIDFILKAFSGQAYTLATHPYGCRVIQRVLEHCPTAHSSILEELHRYTQNLVVDQYGNYVSQHLIERGSPQDKSRVIGVVKGQVLTLSKHKFASNVVEKCVVFGDAGERHMLIEEVLALSPDGQSNLSALMKDQYGNYVLQKMLEVSEGAQRHELANKIRPLLESLKKFSYGKHLSSIERLLERSSLQPSARTSPALSMTGDLGQ